MKKGHVIVLSCLFSYFWFASSVVAQSEYVLPYPSSMPGNKFYIIEQGIERISPYWFYGDLGSFTHNLFYSDKYLVQAKTLFEYKQYLLGMDALQKSNKYFNNLDEKLDSAKANGKDVSEKMRVLESAKKKHREVLFEMIEDSPEEVLWTEENGSSSTLSIHKLLTNSITQRK